MVCVKTLRQIRLCAWEGAGTEFRQAPGFGLEHMATVNRQAGEGVFIFPALLSCN